MCCKGVVQGGGQTCGREPMLIHELAAFSLRNRGISLKKKKEEECSWQKEDHWQRAPTAWGDAGSERISVHFENKICDSVSRNESGNESGGTGHIINPGPYGGFYLNSGANPPQRFQQGTA